MYKSEYLNRVYESIVKRDPNEPEYLQAVREVFESLDLVVDKHPEWEGRTHRTLCGARTGAGIPGTLGGRSGKGTGQPRLPCPV